MSVRALLLIAVVVLAPALHAGESRGLVLARKARRAADAGDYVLARELLDQARIEWPGSTILAHANGDVLAEMGDAEGAIDSYIKGLGEPYAFRSYFNQGVVRSEATEAALAEAGVPLDPAGLPEQVPSPQTMIDAIDAALPQLQASRTHFLDALREQSDEAARESVAALTRRMDDLLEMREELERQQQEQEDQEDQEGEDEQEDQEQEQEGDQDEDGEQDQQEQDPGEDGEQDQQDPSEGEDEQEPTDDSQVPQPQAQPQQLTPQQLEELLEQLEELEEQARELQAARRAAQRRGVEKDW